MGRDEEEIMQKMEQYILMQKIEQYLSEQKIEKQQYNCLTMIAKSIKGTWAFNFWTDTFNKLEKKLQLYKK